MNDNSDRFMQAAIAFAAIIGGIILSALLFLIVYEISGVLPPFFYALIIVYLLRPFVNIMVKNNIPRTLAVSIVYIVVLLAATVTIFYVLPIVIEQISQLVSDFPDYLKAVVSYFSQLKIAFYKINLPAGAEGIIEELAQKARRSALGLFSTLPEQTFGLFGGILNIVLAPIIAFYVLKDLPLIKENILRLVPERFRKEFLHVVKEIDVAVGGFLRGQALVSLVVGVTVSIFLVVIGVNFPVLLGMLAGILNIIPYFGPVLGGGIAAIVALFESPRLALIVILGMLAIQQFDSTIISPTIMRHAVDLHPTAVIFSLLVGGTLFGFLGLLLAIPVAAVTKALLLHYVYAQPVEIAEE